MPTLQIKCKGADVLALADLNEMQGELKSLDTENYEKLRRQIERGFKFTFAVWLNPSDKRYYILDGHQRYRTIKRMQSDGWTIPPLPVSITEAETLAEAQADLLGGASSFGKPEEQGLYEYISKSELTVDEALELSSLSGIDYDDFVEEYFETKKVDEDANNTIDIKEEWLIVINCRDEHHQQDIYNEMQSRGEKCKIM